MFNRLPSGEPAELSITVDGVPVKARCGETVAAALLAAGFLAFRRTPVSGTERGPFCLMGTCHDCLVIIDGVGNRQACLHTVRDGIRIELQPGRRDLKGETTE